MSDPVSYSAVLPIGESTAALGSFAQAVMVLRWFLDGALWGARSRSWVADQR